MELFILRVVVSYCTAYKFNRLAFIFYFHLNVGCVSLGNVYEGEFVNGKKHGQGTLTYPHGDQFKGQWEDDKRIPSPGTFVSKAGLYTSLRLVYAAGRSP